MSLIIRSSAIHAAGCYTTAAIKKGARIIEYTGPRITKEEADEKYQNSPTTYLFGVGNGSYVIDGHSTAMFINHSCEPNCETVQLNERVWVKALRDIAAGEELTYDYNLYDGADDEAFCNCGAAVCRKTMYSEEEVKKRARAAKRAAKNGAMPHPKRDATNKRAERSS
jgi:SET domain-containing protein